MRNNLLPIAKEGWQYIAYSILAIFVFSILGLGILELLAIFISGFFIYIYRNPERESIIYEKNSVVSPADGTVISIDEINDGKEYSYKITINSDYFDVSLLRSPLSSNILSIKKQSGARLSSFSSLSEKINEQTELVFKDDNENVLKIEHLLNQSFAPIDVNIIKRQKLLQGSRYGVMLSGRTVLYLPQNFRINVSIGDQVKASQTLIGYFS